MIVDGKGIAEKIFVALEDDINHRGIVPRLDVIMAGSTPASEKFVAVKSAKAHELGITVMVHPFGDDIGEDELLDAIQRVADDKAVDGIVIQLPLPPHISYENVINAIPVEKDIDALRSDTTNKLPPVAGAIAEILMYHKIEVKGKKVLVVGKGKLVGIPAATWFESQGATVTSIDQYTNDTEKFFKEADIIVSGAGRPHMIKPEMIKDGVVLLDAGTSESEGKLHGDAHPACAEKCKLFTPVPGGIGPVTIAVLLQNLVVAVKD